MPEVLCSGGPAADGAVEVRAQAIAEVTNAYEEKVTALENEIAALKAKLPSAASEKAAGSGVAAVRSRSASSKHAPAQRDDAGSTSAHPNAGVDSPESSEGQPLEDAWTTSAWLSSLGVAKHVAGALLGGGGEKPADELAAMRAFGKEASEQTIADRLHKNDLVSVIAKAVLPELQRLAVANPKQRDAVHAPLAPEERASSEGPSSGKGVSIEALQLLSQLDEQKLIKALESEDIRLGRREWLLAQPDDYRLQKRQDLEERERDGESPLLRGHEAVALIRNGQREVGVLSYGWLLPWEADPTGERLGVLRDALRAHPHLKALFIDQATLYQHPRTEKQEEQFNRALDVMGDLYASAVGTTVLQLKEIPPRPRDYDGILCLGELAKSADEQRIRSVLEERFGAITNCELNVHPGARVTFADHEAAERAAAAAETTELCAFAVLAWNDRAYDEIDAGGDGRGWCVFEEGVSVELIARLETYPKMKAVLDALPPKVLALSSSALPKPVAVSADDARVARVTGKIEKATFTGPSDKPRVVGIYREFVERITRVLTSTLKLAAGAPVLQLPTMPDGGGAQLLKWHVDCLRVQHASIPDALSGKRIDTREDCVPIAISGKDAEGRPLEGVRDASGLATWLQGLRGEGALITAEPAAGKTWLLSQVIVRCLESARVPILIKVEQLQTRWAEVAKQDDWLSAYLELTCSSPQYSAILRNCITEHRALLLVDGLDEAGALRAEIEKGVAGLVAGGQTLLCTSRPAGLHEALFASFHKLQLSRLSDAQQGGFLTKRLGEARASGLRPYLREKVPVDEMQRRVTSNPLMLSMVASIAELRAGIEMPTTTAELYEVAADLLLSRAGKPSDAAQALLQATFFEAHVEQQRVITEEHLQAAAARLGSGAIDELRSLVLKDQLPLMRLLHAEPLQMQAFHLSFQEFYAMRALRDDHALELPQFHWEVWWSNAVRMGVQTGAKFGDAFADAAGLQRIEASKASEPSEAWRARIVSALVKEGLPSPWLATVVEAAGGDRTDAAQLKAFVGRHRDILEREGGRAVAQLALQEPLETPLFQMLRAAPMQRLLTWRNMPQRPDPCVATFTHQGSVNGSAVSKTLIVGGAGKSVYVYDAATEELLGKLDGPSDVKSVTIFEKDADERSGLILAGYENGTLKVWDAGVSTDPPKPLTHT